VINAWTVTGVWMTHVCACNSRQPRYNHQKCYIKMDNWILDLGRAVTGDRMTQVCARNPHVYMWIECMYVVCVCVRM